MNCLKKSLKFAQYHWVLLLNIYQYCFANRKSAELESYSVSLFALSSAKAHTSQCPKELNGDVIFGKRWNVYTDPNTCKQNQTKTVLKNYYCHRLFPTLFFILFIFPHRALFWNGYNKSKEKNDCNEFFIKWQQRIHVWQASISVLKLNI